jgi:hypothetical protein
MRNRRALACVAGAFISSLAFAQSLAPSNEALVIRAARVRWAPQPTFSKARLRPPR